MDLKKVFRAIGYQMLIDFDSFHSEIQHMGERGNEREANLKLFLEAYLPKRFAIEKGEIVDSKGNVSRQCDLIIYDAINSPVLLSGKDYRVFPAESVYAVVEVKSVLDGNQFQKASENICSVKRLHRENGKIAGIVFAYKAEQKRHPILRHLTERIRKTNKTLSPAEYVELWCILDSGIVSLWDQNGSTKVSENFSERRLFSLEPEDGELPVLLWFFIQLLDLLDGQKVVTPNYTNYTGGGAMGICSITNPIWDDD
jgi:hypothetical protein